MRIFVYEANNAPAHILGKESRMRLISPHYRDDGWGKEMGSQEYQVSNAVLLSTLFQLIECMESKPWCQFCKQLVLVLTNSQPTLEIEKSTVYHHAISSVEMCFMSVINGLVTSILYDMMWNYAIILKMTLNRHCGLDMTVARQIFHGLADQLKGNSRR